ncbi:signal recognition particle 19 kDa protein-like [Ruditapes philippinarum]|uniref:signal recognition particle 19 kDa protein-like n=1 Tax=Ruditapes philippinarum TaxID=129788 RepID=UPI00295A5A1A|nr:signal recognition particle 19 kDa protein-like [Ruditapes philippinarum]
MAGPQTNQQARSWDPKFTHEDRERWVCVYPAYINSKKTVKEGRRIPKDKAVENPSYIEIRDVCLSAQLIIGVENKTYCRELEHKDLKYRGRIRIQLKNEDGSLKYEKFPNKQSILLYLGETIPKLKTRQHGGGGSQQGAQQQQGGKSQKKKGRKGK